MHLPDPAYVAFGTAVVSLATAITGVIRVIFEKKRPTPYETAALSGLQKKLI